MAIFKNIFHIIYFGTYVRKKKFILILDFLIENRRIKNRILNNIVRVQILFEIII